MAGFFSIEQYQRTKPRVSSIPGCGVCGLHKECKSPKMEPYGNNEKRIMMIAQSPGVKEDRRNQHLVGEAGAYLKKTANKIGLDIQQDCVKLNAVLCCTGDKDPTSQMIDLCRPTVLKQIEKYKPHVIVALGYAGMESITGHRSPKKLGGIHKIRGASIPDRDLGAWVVPTYHPGYVQYAKEKTPFVVQTFENDLRLALQLSRKKLPTWRDEAKDVEILTRVPEIRRYLQSLLDTPPEFAAFDYETTGLKPQKKGHRIYTSAISTDGIHAVAFPMLDEIVDLFIRFLRHPRIKKIAANMKFEEIWSRVKLGTRVKYWYHDTMLGAHVLDNRPGITSLKHQAYIKYGIIDYDSHIAPFLESQNDEDGGNGFNRIHEVDQTDLLVYNGVDAILEYRLAMDQIEDPTMTWPGYDLLHEGSESLADCEYDGIKVDLEYCKNKHAHLTRRIAHMERKLQETDILKLWKKTYGYKFNIASDDQLADILFNKLGYKPEVMTTNKDNPKPSVSQAALELLDIDMVKDLVEIRRTKKARDTYLGNYITETVDGLLHPFFHLHIVVSFRSSSSKINFQNQPVRIPEIKKLVRTAVIPRTGRMLSELDYSGVEVSIATCYHKDPVMIEEITNPAKDMHRDMAMECYLLDEDEWTEETRYCGKNKFVFPQFYGDYYGNNAKDLFNAIGQMSLTTRKGDPLLTHLKKHRLGTLGKFTDHIKAVEERFWGDRFRVYAAWKEKHWQLYLENGYVDLLSGFRCSAIMSRNEAINYPPQGSAFHCLLWSKIQLNKWLRRNNMGTTIIGQIHDSIVLDIVPEEANEVFAMARKIMTEDLARHHPWIIVPMKVDVEITPVDGSWFLKKKVKEHDCPECGMGWMYNNKIEGTRRELWECPRCSAREETDLAA